MNYQREFISLIKKSNLVEIQSFYEQYKQYSDISALNEVAFRWTCENGHLDIAQWLYQIKPTIDISAQDEEAFRGTCQNGHLEVAQWLYHIKPTINISANSVEEAEKYFEQGFPSVVVVPENQPEKTTTKTGKKLVVCPEQTGKAESCAKCLLCARKNRKVIIGFRVHGAGKNKISFNQ